MLVPAVRTTVARWLEAGTLSGSWSHALSSVHAPFATRAVARPLDAGDLLTVTVGGATLGGSGKTRVALACARELARLGASVVLVGHAYRARPGSARVVAPSDHLGDVGDEALACARSLGGEPHARVVVAPTRQAAVDLAKQLAPRVDVVVIDGPLQLAPRRSSLALLAVDSGAPWGAGHVPPAGDLRAPREALLAAADHVVGVDATPRMAALGGHPVELASLAGSRARLGLFTAIARPDRLERALATVGLAPAVVVRAADHGPLTPDLARALSRPVDVWLATEKCALHLEGVELGPPVAVLDGTTPLPSSITQVLAALMTRKKPSIAGLGVGALPTCVA